MRERAHSSSHGEYSVRWEATTQTSSISHAQQFTVSLCLLVSLSFLPSARAWHYIHHSGCRGRLCTIKYNVGKKKKRLSALSPFQTEGLKNFYEKENMFLKRWGWSNHYQWNYFTRYVDKKKDTECLVQINCLHTVIILPPRGFYQNRYLMAENFWLKLAQLAAAHSYSVSWKRKWPTSIFLPHPSRPLWHHS